RLQRDIKVSVDRTEVRAGDYVTVNWSGNTLTELVPAYLIVATDAPVRFKGEGFYALMPNAIGPFGIETFKDRTRAIVPLYGKGAQKAGAIPIEGILAGRIPLEYAVIGWQRRCQVESAEAVSLGEVKVKPAGAPVIDLDDRLAVEQPERYLVNADGTRLIDERENGTWRLLDAETLQVIFEGTGTEPRFSETGRFVSALNEEHMFVFDAVDGSLLHKDNFKSVTWDNHDSFIGFSFYSWGAFRAFNSLNFNNEYSRGGGPRIESGNDLPVFDLENNLAVSLDYGGSSGFRIDLPDVQINGPGADMESRTVSFAASELDPFLVSRFSGGLRYAHVNRHRKTNGLLEMEATNAAENCPSCRELYQAFTEKYVKPAYLDSNKVVQLGVAESASQNTLTRAVLTRSGVLTGNGAFDSLVSFGLGVLDRTEATYSGSVGKTAGEAWNEPNPEQVKFGLELAQLIRNDIVDSASFFKNAGDTYGVDYAYRYELGGRVLWLTQAVIMGGSQGNFFNSQMVLFHDGMDGDPYSTQFDNPSSDIGTECYGSLSYCRVETAAFAQRYLAIWSAEARGVAVFDAKSTKFIFKKFDLPRGDLLQSVAMTTDERHLLQQNSDGTFYVHRIGDGATVLEGRIVDDEVIVWTPDMRFDSTAEGAHFVNLRFPGQIGQYTFQQFDSRLRVPGLAQKVLAG
ncbi:MAG: hypothetical protein KDE63_13315, partial [Novosphingobium sp.]|nr:hypothetical protein [Novosphingobium sp.]